MSSNKFELTRKDYVGAKSTLCTGCGHDSITQHLISALFKSDVHPFNIAKLSGIGCSSKTTNYFLNQSHGFNSIHGRMGSLATGAKLANRNLQIIGISGDGDSASIGLGSFMHLLRRNLPMVYIVENNGVYGLTKGQLSATAEQEMKMKNGDPNHFEGMDLCSLAIESGCHFVARAFSGDAKQLVPLLSAAMKHPGTAFIDVVSPCITYANHDGSTRSYDYVKEHKLSLQELGYIADGESPEADYAPGESIEVPMADGSKLLLKKLKESHDHSDRLSAMKSLFEARQNQEILTGLIYYKPNESNTLSALELGDTPLIQLGQKDLQPSAESLKEIMKAFR